ncbi:MAG TPA: GNAT family N-acetyltransferase [Chloroflexi bacterium]|nr:GNAT family N-acetyltransferase [Chloroflexota bacterium]
MASAFTHQRDITARGEGLCPTNLIRDLYQIAELIELCFGSRLDESGRAAVREMKFIARSGPLLWLLGLFNRIGIGPGRGYVWREQGRVVGNVSLYNAGQHPDLGAGWLIANVAVHPDYRRRGIAQALMHAAMKLARRKGGRWAALQVEADNGAALALYRRLGFEEFETLTQWETAMLRVPEDLSLSPERRRWPVRRRRPSEVSAESDLIFRHARRGGMGWTRTIDRHDLVDNPFMWLLRPDYRLRERWVLPAAESGRLLGSAWIELTTPQRLRVSLFFDPSLPPAGREALLAWVLTRPALRGRRIRLEMASGEPAIEGLLQKSGFQQVRALIQMRRILNARE